MELDLEVAEEGDVESAEEIDPAVAWAGGGVGCGGVVEIGFAAGGETVGDVAGAVDGDFGRDGQGGVFGAVGSGFGAGDEIAVRFEGEDGLRADGGDGGDEDRGSEGETAGAGDGAGDAAWAWGGFGGEGEGEGLEPDVPVFEAMGSGAVEFGFIGTAVAVEGEGGEALVEGGGAAVHTGRERFDDDARGRCGISVRAGEIAGDVEPAADGGEDIEVIEVAEGDAGEVAAEAVEEDGAEGGRGVGSGTGGLVATGDPAEAGVVFGGRVERIGVGGVADFAAAEDAPCVL